MGASGVWPIVLALLGGCITQSDSTSGTYGGGSWGTGPGGSGGSSGFGCHMDSDCPTSDVCARDGECLLASQVRIVHVTWTLQGQAASTQTCASAPNLELTFSDRGESFGFAPVPCVEGKFTVDKLPTRYTIVELDREGQYNGGPTTSFDANGLAMLDLPY